jgi:hypothetical protein
MYNMGAAEIKILKNPYDFGDVIVPTLDTGDKVVIWVPDGKGWWAEREVERGVMPNRDEYPILSIPFGWQQKIYAELKKKYDPQNTISVDAVKIQEKHLEDMRQLLFHQLKVGAPWS